MSKGDKKYQKFKKSIINEKRIKKAKTYKRIKKLKKVKKIHKSDNELSCEFLEIIRKRTQKVPKVQNF